jgi:alpha-mannosidase
MRAGEEMNVPLVISSCTFHDGDLPNAMSFVRVEDENVRLAAMKSDRDGESMVLRLVEVEGRQTEARLRLASSLLPKGATAVEVDTLERPLDDGRVRLEEGTLTVELPPYGISTVCITQ